MKKVAGWMIALSIIGLVFYGLGCGAMAAWDWAGGTDAPGNAARAVDRTLDKGIEKTQDTSWFSKWMHEHGG